MPPAGAGLHADTLSPILPDIGRGGVRIACMRVALSMMREAIE